MAGAYPNPTHQHLSAAAMFVLEVTRIDPHWAEWSETDVSAIRYRLCPCLSCILDLFSSYTTIVDKILKVIHRDYQFKSSGAYLLSTQKLMKPQSANVSAGHLAASKFLPQHVSDSGIQNPHAPVKCQ